MVGQDQFAFGNSGMMQDAVRVALMSAFRQRLVVIIREVSSREKVGP